MLTSARVLTVAGYVCIAGAGWIVVAGDSALIAAVLLLGARALLDPADRGWVSASAPVWGAVVAVAAWRAGSIAIADIGGANAVLGAGLVRGDVLVVVSLWAATIAAVAAAGAPRGTGARLAWGAQALLLIALVAAPQVTSVSDVVMWFAALGFAAAQVAGARFAGPAARLLVARSAAVVAVAAGVLA